MFGAEVIPLYVGNVKMNEGYEHRVYIGTNLPDALVATEDAIAHFSATGGTLEHFNIKPDGSLVLLEVRDIEPSKNHVAYANKMAEEEYRRPCSFCGGSGRKDLYRVGNGPSPKCCHCGGSGLEPSEPREEGCFKQH